MVRCSLHLLVAMVWLPAGIGSRIDLHPLSAEHDRVGNVARVSVAGSPVIVAEMNSSRFPDLGDIFGGATDAVEEPKGWVAVKAILNRYSMLGFTVGTSKKRHFKFSNFRSSDAVSPGMSIGKWPAAVAIAGVVSEGLLSFDTKCGEVWEWWSKDPNDPRSRVTLRHLLSFTSGFGATAGDPLHAGGHNPITVPCLTTAFPGQSPWPLSLCAQQIYTNVGAFGIDEPGTAWSYNNYHIQLALAMAAEKTGLTGREFMQKYLHEPYGMNSTWWTGGWNPFMAGGIMSNSDDMDSFIRKVLGHRVLKPEVALEMDQEVVHAQGLVQRIGFVQVATPSAYEWSMGHVVSKSCFPEPPGSPFGASSFKYPVSWWRGATGWSLYMDRKADIYIACLPAGYAFLTGKPDPINVVLEKVYSAMGVEWPGVEPTRYSRM